MHAQGDDVLREELGALDEGHLRNIIRAYGLAKGEPEELAGTDRAGLVDLIVTAVQERVG